MKHHLLKICVGVFVAVAVLVTAFAWPAVNTAPREVPIGVAALQPVAHTIEQRLAAAQPGAFTVTTYTDEAAARTAIEQREIYGAIVLSGGEPALLTAPAASPAVAQLLDQVARGLDGTEGPTVEQVVPLPQEDPRGAGLMAGALPLVLMAIAIGAASALAFTSAAHRVTALVGASASAGLSAALVLGTWLGVLPQNFWAVAGVISLGVLAGAALVAGLASVFGRPGIALGGATLMLLGNPFSGAASAPELLPHGWAELGQLLPLGALVSALRSVAYFDGAASATPLVVLGAWMFIGLAMVAIGSQLRTPATMPTNLGELAAAR